MNQTTIRLEPDLKRDFTRVCDDMGLTVSTAITIFAKTVVRERRIPFEISSPISLDEQIITAALKRNPKRVKLETDDNGKVIINKELHPDIYDWAVNG